MVPAELVALASSLADAARGVTMRSAGETVAVTNKSATGRFDPVTEADQGAERAMRDLIARTCPDHGIRGEELGTTSGTSPYSWSLDPIDGTRSYMCGLPTWTTLVALLDHGDPVLGLIDAPRLDERFLGHGGNAWLSGAAGERRLCASDCTDLASARLATTDPFLFDGQSHEAFRTLCAAARATRFGHDAYAYARLASGSIDLVVECGLQPYDYQALIPVVRGAGGVFGDWDGGTDFGAGRVIAAATPQLYDAAVSIMSGAA